MQTLLIEVEGRVLRFDAPRLVRIGRSIEADVVLSSGSVSRAHAELRPVDGGWVLVDAGSQHGTYVDGRRVRERAVDGPTTVQCGPPAPGSTLTITPETVGSAGPKGRAPAPTPPRPQQGPPPPPPVDPAPGAPPTGAGGGYDETFVLAAPPPGIAGSPHPAPPRSGPDLLVVAEGREHRFRHPTQLTVGRLPECDIVISDPVCSRMHGQIHPVPGGWTFVNSSQEGSFLDGRRIDRQGFEETLRLRLGHPVAGPQLTLVPILSAAEEERRFARRRRRRTLLRVGIGLAVLALVVGTVTTAALVGGGDESPDGPRDRDTMAVLTEDELDSAKAATVRLLGTSTDTSTGLPVEYTGSGSIISEDGLILTNAHVAAPEAPGLQEQYGSIGMENPDYLLVALTEGASDTPSAPAYRARLVEADGALDAAVIEVYADEDGNQVDPEELDLPALPLGDSDELRTGDPVTVLGFPGISRSGAVTVTTGVISTFIDTDDLGPRSEIDTDARIAPGNSGGAAINNDAEIIGIPSAFFREGEVPIVSGRIRPINLVMDLIEKAGG